jgi:hypothetical protein
VQEFYDDTIWWHEATRVPVVAGAETDGINFALAPAE